VARDGRVILARGYGMANLEHSVAVTPETVFHIASISKNILAAVVLQLVDEGKLRQDDDVTKYVPEAPTQGITSLSGNFLIILLASTASPRCPTPPTTSDSNLRTSRCSH
jgi:CubicO group peptidase (beta-lactamase class C family)